jgi:hypothetical protein
MGLTDDREILVAENPTAFADAVVRLYTDEELWISVSGAGLEFMARNLSVAAGRERLRGMLDQLGVLKAR